MSLLVWTAAATTPIGATVEGGGVQGLGVAIVSDGGAARNLIRTARGTDAHPAAVTLVDAATGRQTTGTVASTAIVQLEAGADVVALARRHHLVVRRPLMARAGLWLVAGSDGGEDGVDVAVRLQAAHDPALREAFPNLALRHRTAQADADVVPNDPRYSAQFFLRELQIEGAWALSRGSADIVVSVVDNGCDVDHPDLAAKMNPGHDVITDDENPSFSPNTQGNEHGTACSGLIAAVTDNNLDVAGACPLCRLTCTRLLGANSEPIPLDADVRAFDHALEDDVAIVSNSWGFVDAIPVPAVLRAAIVEVQQNGRGGLGAVVVFAAGNDSRDISDDELLAVDGVLGVGATNNLGELTQFSNRGPSVDVTAPTGTVTTDIAGADGDNADDVTVRFGGTSSACPLVAGVAGLILAADPGLTSDEVNDILERTAQQSPFARPGADGHDNEYGFGLVRADLALAAVVGDSPAGDGNGDGAGGCNCDNSAAIMLAPLLLPLRRRRRRAG